MHPLKVSVSRGPPTIMPNDLIPVVLLTEDCIHYEFEIVAGVGVTMQVDASSILQDAVHDKQPLRHVGGIGEHLALWNELFKPSNHLRGGVRNSILDMCDAFRRRIVPKPDIIKRFDLWINKES